MYDPICIEAMNAEIAELRALIGQATRFEFVAGAIAAFVVVPGSPDERWVVNDYRNGYHVKAYATQAEALADARERSKPKEEIPW